MSKLDFLVSAEIFVKSKLIGWAKNSVRYRRFDSLSSAIEFAVREYGDNLKAVSIQTATDEYTGLAIRSLYENELYPLKGRLAVHPGVARAGGDSVHSAIRKFKVGETVRYLHSGRARQSGHYEVVKVLPIENAEPTYRIKSESEQYERAVKEHEITLV
ncbi:hypothetical protein [Labrys sp. ZIDIC5]|uniref:hypothetical protein n=1 Tax=Labrys sedimenti TaxID=3106036 RepID=UPI002ACA4435|nr:hypothetical protein [Labrys sp. ZIDIC5]MDZ5454796.1 hypothetical protein [Labrys sp. ZIDIC5]